jgi:hypothetical protein
MRKSTVMSLPLQLVFPDQTVLNGLLVDVLKIKKYSHPFIFEQLRVPSSVPATPNLSGVPMLGVSISGVNIIKLFSFVTDAATK